jgi:hypothetical protein
MSNKYYLTLPALISGAFWVLERVLPDLIKIPEFIAKPLASLAGVIIVVSVLAYGWRWMARRVPRPWLPRPIWRARTWLAHRPTLSIITATPKIVTSATTMDECKITLQIARSLSASPTRARICFDHAFLEFRRTDRKRAEPFIFRPVEAGGFLALEMEPRSWNSVILEFSGVRFPIHLPHAPQFDGDYELTLRGVRAVFGGRKGFEGELPPVVWRWFRALNSSTPSFQNPIVYPPSEAFG